jgi:hypothetical protein
MRELFRAMVRDGDVSDDDRICFQNVAVLLSQVDGNTWVNFHDTEGELKDLTPQQLKKLRPFLQQVAAELKASEKEVLGDGGNSLDVLKLVDVPWSDGITERELLGCCQPDPELETPPRLAWLDKATKVVPSQYMLRSRVRELINYYALQRITPEALEHREPRPSLSQRVEKVGFPGARCLVWCCLQIVGVASLMFGIVKTATLFFCRSFKDCIFAAATPVAGIVFTAAAMFVQLASRLCALIPGSGGPLWPTVRLFCAAVLIQQAKRFFEVLILIARLRVILCLASCNHTLSMVLYPFTFIAHKMLNWNEGSRIMGCACARGVYVSLSDVSVFSLIPVAAVDGLVWLLKLIRFAPLSTPAMLWFLDAVDVVHLPLAFLFDLMFSIGISEGLKMVVDRAEDHAKPKLVWMSMNLSRKMRGNDFAITGTAG